MRTNVADESAMLDVREVCKEYRRGCTVIQALDRLSLKVPQGEFCALMGPSGSGKSTLLNLIAGLDNPTSGEIMIEGQSTRTFSDKDWTHMRRVTLGMVFQAFHLVPGLTAAENVGLPLILSGTLSSVVKERVREGLEMVGMEDRGHHSASELSGGEQQRVAIARAFIHQPKILLADEPTGNLDSKTAKEIVTLLRKLSEHWKQTVILVTHSEMAGGIADRRYDIRDGQLYEIFNAN